jgi:Sulfotransferase family
VTPPCFPFVVGCGRSGTTLLRAMLDSHPALVIPPESRFIPALLEAAPQLGRSGRLDTDALVDLLLDDEHFRAWGLPADELRVHLHACAPADVPDAVRAMFQLRATAAGKPRYGDKSPPYVMRLPLLAEAFPEGRFVHLVRDGRDVALAFMDADFGPESAAHLALHWRLRVERGRQAGTTLGPERYLEVHYEELVAQPEPVLRAICDFVDLEYDGEMLGYQTRVDEIVQFDPEPWNHRNLEKPPTVGLRDWRSQMKPRDVARFELLAGHTLRRYSYATSDISATTRDRYDAAATLATWQARRVRKRVGAIYSAGRHRVRSS